MPKLAWNAFIDKYKDKPRLGVVVQFPNYTASTRKLRKQGAIQREGKKMPTPNQTISALARSVVKGDYAIDSNGDFQNVMFSDLKDAEAFRKNIPCSPWKRGDAKPYTAACGGILDPTPFRNLVGRLGLF